MGLVLMVLGLSGALVAIGYERACGWADLGLVTAHARRRIALFQRRRPELLTASLALAACGVLVGAL